MSKDTFFQYAMIALLLITWAACNKVSEETKTSEPQSEEVTTVANPSAMIEPLVLWEEINAGEKRVIIEVSKPAQFAEGHIPNAMNCYRPDFSADEGAYDYGGMRPEAAKLEELLQRLGANTGDEIVIYDKKGNCDAARLWWLLRLHNYPKVKILNGGMVAWMQDSLPVSTKQNQPEKGNFTLEENIETKSMLAGYTDMVQAISDSNIIIIDTRTTEEYTGAKHKNGALKPGRIPGAINHDWANCVQFEKDMRFKSLKDINWELKEQGLADLNTPIIVYCHSGVRSSHSAFVLREILGYTNVRNYDGSWTEWSHLAADSLIESDL